MSGLDAFLKPTARPRSGGSGDVLLQHATWPFLPCRPRACFLLLADFFMAQSPPAVSPELAHSAFRPPAAGKLAIRQMARSGMGFTQEAIAMQEIHNPKRESSGPFGGLKEFVVHVSGHGDSDECDEVTPQVPEWAFEKPKEVSSDA